MLSSRAFTVAGPAPVQTVESVEVIAVPEMLPQAPQWSPDGAWLSFSGARGTGIGLVRPDGSGLHWLSREPGEGWRHAWSPDSAFIVSRSRRAGPEMRQFVIRVISAARGAEGSRLEAGGEVQPPFWQSGKEGMRWICQDGESARTGPWLIPATGGSENAVPRPPLLHYRGLQPGRMSPEGFAPLSNVRAQDPHWNAAGIQAAFDAPDRIDFWDGTSAAARVLAPGQHPALSPDGGWIAYQLTRDHNHAPASSQAHTPDTMPHLHSCLTALALDEVCADFPGVDLSAPVITSQPESVAVEEGSQAVFSGAAAASGGLMWRWRHNGADLSDGDRIGGSGTPTLTILWCGRSDAGLYTARVTGGGLPVVTQEAQLEIMTPLLLPGTVRDSGTVILPAGICMDCTRCGWMR